MKMLLILLSVLVTATSAVAADTIHLSAAASLKEVVTEIADAFRQRQRQVVIFKNFGGSGNLARQIYSGAPADIFIAASPQWVEFLMGKNLTDTHIVNFAGNRLVFAGRTGKSIQDLKSLATLTRITIGNPKSVPAGEYAMAAIKKAGREKELAKKLVLAKDVRECLLYIERGEVDGGFVYISEALLAKHAQIFFTVPQHLYPEIRYPMVLTVAGRSNRAAVSFFSYLQSREAQSILKRHGFLVK